MKCLVRGDSALVLQCPHRIGYLGRLHTIVPQRPTPQSPHSGKNRESKPVGSRHADQITQAPAISQTGCCDWIAGEWDSDRRLSVYCSCGLGKTNISILGQLGDPPSAAVARAPFTPFRHNNGGPTLPAVVSRLVSRSGKDAASPIVALLWLP